MFWKGVEKKECALRLQPTSPLCPYPAPHLWLLLLFAFVLSAPFLTFGIWGSPAPQGKGQQGHWWPLRDRPRPCPPLLGQSPQRGVPMGKDRGCCHCRAQSPSDTLPVRTVPPNQTLPGWVKQSGKRELSTKILPASPSTPFLGGFPSAAFPRSSTKELQDLGEAFSRQINQRKVPVWGV